MLFKEGNDENSAWLSISDLMSGLMIVFLLIAIAYMHNVHRGKLKIKEIAATYQEKQISLYNKLLEEFKDDLPAWKAKISKETLSIQFFEPEILFQPGSAEVTPKFKEILNSFFPRYLNILFSEEFSEAVSEIRIEGHTSSEWSSQIPSVDDAYFNNMDLSQKRTKSVLFYCYTLVNAKNKKLMVKYVTANGLSSSKLVLKDDGSEDKVLSRRVEFRSITNAETKIVQILEELKDD